MCANIMSEPANNDMNEDLIPCEFCEEMVAFYDYTSHANVCTARARNNVMIFDRDVGTLEMNVGHLMNTLLRNLAFSSNQDLASLSNEPLSAARSNAAAVGNLQMSLLYTFIAYDDPEDIEMDDYEFNTLLTEFNGNVERGIDDMNTVCGPVALGLDEVNETMCAICREQFDNIEAPKLKTTCNHVFCEPCISTWLKKSKKCPMCMLDLEELCKKNRKIEIKN